ncbi:MAG: glycerol-3-phosphate 1-O-acyltransferase PlsY [Tuberibacillus sp.]
MLTALSFILAYLIGAISFSIIITKLIKKEDIRNFGSGNAGATNTMRVLGKGPAIIVLLLDVLKGIIAILIAKAFGLEDWAIAVTGLLAIIGHNWPVYFGFRGGKGVATTIGVICMLLLTPGLIAGAVAIIIIILTRYVSLGSLIFTVGTPIVALIFGSYPNSYIIVAALIAVLSLWKHRSNIGRLFQGTENKIGSGVKK